MRPDDSQDSQLLYCSIGLPPACSGAGFVPPQVQDSVLLPVELREILVSPPLQTVKVLVDGLLVSLPCLTLCRLCEYAEGALFPDH